MMTTTKKDIEKAIAELQEALMESIEARDAAIRAELRKTKAQKRLSMARDAVRELSTN